MECVNFLLASCARFVVYKSPIESTTRCDPISFNKKKKKINAKMIVLEPHMPFDLFYSIVQRNKPPTMDIDVSTFPKHSLMLTSFVPLFQLQWQIASRLLLYSVNNNKVPRNQRQMYASCLPKHISESYVFSPCSEKYARRRSITFVCTLRVYGSFVRICVNGVQVQLTLAHL